MGSPNWQVSVFDIHRWVYYPGHAGVKGNDGADRLAGKASITGSLHLGRSEVLRSLRHYLLAQSQGHHTIDRLEERGVERGSTQRSSLIGRERAIHNLTSIGTVSKASLGKLLRVHIGFSKRIDTFLNWTDLNLVWALTKTLVPNFNAQQCGRSTTVDADFVLLPYRNHLHQIEDYVSSGVRSNNNNYKNKTKQNKQETHWVIRTHTLR